MKYIAYKIPFQSYQGVDYEVRIYAETDAQVAPAAVVLYGGEHPFVTEENDSDDIFEAVRHQTGTIQVVDNAGTGDLAGLMEKLCPENNISNPVQLVEKVGYNESVIWQGFLNCESYSQDYIGTPQAIELPVNSVLGAMDSVYLDLDIVGAKTIRKIIAYTFEKLMNDSGMNGIITRIYFSAECYAILDKYLDTSALFEEKEYTNEYVTNYYMDGISCKDVLNRICGFMGMTVREEWQNIYFERIGEKVGMYYSSFSQFKNKTTKTLVSIRDIQMQDFEWMGNTHERSVKQGAKSVEVVANIKKTDFDMSMPESPYDQLNEKEVVINHGYSTHGYVHVFASKNTTFNNLIKLQCLNAKALHCFYEERTPEHPYFEEKDFYIDSVGTVSHGIDVWYDQDVRDWDYFLRFGTMYERRYLPVDLFACFARVSDQDYKSALLVFGLTTSRLGGGVTTENDYLFKMESQLSIVLANCNMTLKMVEQTTKSIGISGKIPMSLKFGDKYWGNNTWNDEFTIFDAEINDNGDCEIDMQISDIMQGKIVLSIYYGLGIENYDYDEERVADQNEAIITELSIKYKKEETPTKSDRGSNHYIELLGVNFSEEVQITTEIASDLNNIESPSIIHNDDKLLEPMSVMDYNLPDGTTEERRPEKDLLDRMAAFYSRVRRRLDLDVAINSVPPFATLFSLPQTTVEGLEETPIRYLPLAISKNWVQGTARLTCIEDITEIVNPEQ